MNLVCEKISDQRRAARRAVEIEAELLTNRWDRPTRARCTDLSPFGMWIETGLSLVEGDEVVVTFRPPRADAELTVFARVRRVEADRTAGVPGVGLELEGVDFEEQQLLARALRGIPPRFPSWPPIEAVSV